MVYVMRVRGCASYGGCCLPERDALRAQAPARSEGLQMTGLHAPQRPARLNLLHSWSSMHLLLHCKGHF